MGSDELTEWMAFYQLEPFGDFRSDLRSAIVAATFANAHRTTQAPPFTPEDFMPFCYTNPKTQPDCSDSASQNIAKFKALFTHRVIKHG